MTESPESLMYDSERPRRIDDRAEGEDASPFSFVETSIISSSSVMSLLSILLRVNEVGRASGYLLRFLPAVR